MFIPFERNCLYRNSGWYSIFNCTDCYLYVLCSHKMLDVLSSRIWVSHMKMVGSFYFPVCHQTVYGLHLLDHTCYLLTSCKLIEYAVSFLLKIWRKDVFLITIILRIKWQNGGGGAGTLLMEHIP